MFTLHVCVQYDLYVHRMMFCLLILSLPDAGRVNKCYLYNINKCYLDCLRCLSLRTDILYTTSSVRWLVDYVKCLRSFSGQSDQHGVRTCVSVAMNQLKMRRRCHIVLSIVVLNGRLALCLNASAHLIKSYMNICQIPENHSQMSADPELMMNWLKMKKYVS